MCPPVVSYSTQQQAKAADELEKLPAGSQLETFVTDYGTLRRQIRAACPGA